MNGEPRLQPSPEAKAWVNEWLDKYVAAMTSAAAVQVADEMGVAFDLAMLRVREHERTGVQVELIAKDYGIGHLGSLVDEVRAENDQLRALIVALNNGKPCCPEEDFTNDGPNAVCYICRCYFGAQRVGAEVEDEGPDHTSESRPGSQPKEP